ncbi:MAG: TetR/AcrR family transcriptional regulator [Syntrophomonadaceae bacterium]|nr:TetR/AcrR family transcriptional regulator [Syntrophomonadaceae bacterium]
MARPARSPEEIKKYKDKIMVTALGMITKNGFENFSMRKLAAKLNITATTIYNYYSSKDEIYLYILIMGFDHLYEDLMDAHESHFDVDEKIRAFIKAYIDFGIKNANYYELMFVRDVPKYNDYVGCKEEKVAQAQLDAALRNVSAWELVYNDLAASYSVLKPSDKWFHLAKIWAGAHGIVSLYNSKVLNYLIEPTTEMMDHYVEQMVSLLFISFDT